MRSVVITCCLGCYLESPQPPRPPPSPRPPAPPPQPPAPPPQPPGDDASLVGPQPLALLASLLAALLLLAVARA